jgi:hypothetical protein
MPSSVCRKFKGAPNRALWRGGWTLELAQFHVRTDRVRVLAETVSDPVRADTCDCLCRTVGEEAGFIADDLDRGGSPPPTSGRSQRSEGALPQLRRHHQRQLRPCR